MSSLIAPLINLLILIGLMAYYLTRPVKAHIHSRHITLREDLERVRNLLRSAKEKHEEFSAKLAAISMETTAIRQQMKQDAAAAKDRLIADARRLSATIVADAKVSASGLFDDLKSGLSSEMAGQILARVEAVIRERLTGDDRARIRKEFSSQMEAVQ